MIVTNHLTIIEQKPATANSDAMLEVQSHWNYSDRVIIVTPDGTSFTVFADDLKKAIDNSCNHKS